MAHAIFKIFRLSNARFSRISKFGKHAKNAPKRSISALGTTNTLLYNLRTAHASMALTRHCTCSPDSTSRSKFAHFKLSYPTRHVTQDSGASPPSQNDGNSHTPRDAGQRCLSALSELWITFVTWKGVTFVTFRLCNSGRGVYPSFVTWEGELL